MTKVEPSSKLRALAGMVRVSQSLYIDGKYSPARSGETFEAMDQYQQTKTIWIATTA